MSWGKTKQFCMRVIPVAYGENQRNLSAGRHRFWLNQQDLVTYFSSGQISRNLQQI
jgi:hypothetical protein